MRTLVPAIALLLLFDKASAQKLLIGASFEPHLSYYTIRADGGSGQDFRQQNKPLISFQTGLNAAFAISEKWRASSGLIYARRGVVSQFNNANVQAFSLSSANSLRVVDHYLEIPLLMLRRIQKPKLHWFYSIGLKPSIYLGSSRKSSLTQAGNSGYYYLGNRRFNVFVSLGGGLEIPVGNSLQLLVWPTLEHAVMGEIMNQNLILYPYSIGMNVCLLYSLGN